MGDIIERGRKAWYRVTIMERKRDFPLLVVALDVTTLSRVKEIINLFPMKEVLFKVGKQLFVAHGPEAVTAVHSLGGRCLLDLKFFDIPNTVEKAVMEATRLGIWGMTLHALGGRRMLEAARKAVDRISREMRHPPPHLFAVTLLTSMDATTLKEIGITAPMEISVLHLADLAIKAGMDGIVASPLEASTLRKTLGNDFLIMTPGIRLAPQPEDDQRRVATPKEALASGADLIVMGRSLLNTSNPGETAKEILALLRADLA